VAGRFNPEGRAPDTQWTEWVGPRDGLDAVAKRKKCLLYLCREWNPGRPTRNLVIIVTEVLVSDDVMFNEIF